MAETPKKKTLSTEIIKLDDFRTFLSYMPNPDITLQKSNEGLEIFREMDTDGRLSSLFRLRRGATLGLPIRFVPSGEDKIDDFIKGALPTKFIRRLAESLMDALKFGYQPVEIVWKQKDGRWWVPDYSKQQPSEYFQFDSDGTPVFLSGSGEERIKAKYKLLVHRNEGSKHENYYGLSVYSQCYWIWQFKRLGFQFWVTATERFSVPTIIAVFEIDDENKAQERAGELADLISQIQSGSSGAFSNIKDLKQIETKGSVSGFRTLIDTCNAEMSYAVTGQSLATGEAEYGTRSQGEVHERVLHSFVEHDAKDLCLTMQEVIDWIIELNFPGAASPTIEIDTGDYASWDQVKDAIDSGIPVSKNALYSVYGLPEPKDNEDSFIRKASPISTEFSDRLKTEGFFFADRETQVDTEILKDELKKANQLEAVSEAAQESIQKQIEKTLELFISSLKKDEKLIHHKYIPESDEQIVESTFDTLLLSSLTGIDHAADTKAFADLEYLPAGLSFEEASEFMKSRIPLTKKELNDLSDKLKYRAFTVGRLTQLDAIDAVRKHLIKAIQKGESLGRFLDKVNAAEMLGIAGWSSETPWYWENVYRTNIQTCYNSGRLIQFSKNEPLYLEFIGIDDVRQTQDICAPRTGIIRAYNDPWWRYNIPPLHFACRSTVRGIYKAEAEVLGLVETNIPKDAFAPQKGFGLDPLLSEKYWKPTDTMKRRLMGYGITDEINAAAKQLKLDIKIDEAKGLAQRFPVNTYADVSELMKAYDLENPGVFRNGSFKTIEVVRADYFMATDIRGTIKLSNKRFSFIGGFQPSVDLKNALKKIGRNEKLSFHEEYAIESLWHEIQHNARTGGRVTRRDRVNYSLMEAVNQLYARNSYDEFLKTLGGVSQYKEKILREGYGYGETVFRFRYLLNKFDVDETEVSLLLHKQLDSEWSLLSRNCAEIIAKKTGDEVYQVQTLLEEMIHKNDTKDFMALVDMFIQ